MDCFEDRRVAVLEVILDLNRIGKSIRKIEKSNKDNRGSQKVKRFNRLRNLNEKKNYKRMPKIKDK